MGLRNLEGSDNYLEKLERRVRDVLLRIDVLNERTDRLTHRLEELERNVGKIVRPIDILEEQESEDMEYEWLTVALRLQNIDIGMYGEQLEIAERLRRVQHYLKQKPIIHDDISKCILVAVALTNGKLNASSITHLVKLLRGKASRGIVQKRFRELQEQGLLLKTNGRVPTYELAEGGR